MEEWDKEQGKSFFFQFFFFIKETQMMPIWIISQKNEDRVPNVIELVELTLPFAMI